MRGKADLCILVWLRRLAQMKAKYLLLLAEHSWLQFFNHINASLPLQPATTPDFVPMNAMWRIPNSDHHGECNLEEGIVWEHKYKTLINVM